MNLYRIGNLIFYMHHILYNKSTLGEINRWIKKCFLCVSSDSQIGLLRFPILYEQNILVN